MKGRWIVYSAEELAFIKDNSTMVRSQLHRLFCNRFARDDVSQDALNALCKRKGWMTGRTGCFPKGQTAHNKGKKCAPGTGGNHPNARKTQFQKGGLSGSAKAQYKPIGTERISKDGYREVKVSDTGATRERWQAIHRIKWEAMRGPIPDGYCLKCLSDDKLNTDPGNWALIPRAMLPRLNGGRNKAHVAYDEAPAALKPAILTVAKLDHAVRSARKAA